MKILKMKLENFQGVKELEIEPQGESSAIYGDNGTGKSTVYKVKSGEYSMFSIGGTAIREEVEDDDGAAAE